MTPDATLDPFVNRLNHLERQLRWWKLAGCVLVAGLMIAAIAQQTFSKSKAVDAERFVVRDESGSVRAVFGVGVGNSGREESVGLRFASRNGVTRADFFLDLDGTPFLRLRDSEGKVVVQADVSPNDVPGVVLWRRRAGTNGPRPTILVTFGKDDLPTLMLADQRGRVSWKAP